MKKVLLVLLTIGLVLPMAAHAGPPVDVEGDFYYFPTGCEEERWANDNQFLLNCADTGEWYQGDFSGTSTEEYDVVLHGSQGDFVYEYANYKGTVTFTGTVAGKTGTLELKMVGTSKGDVANWSGTWRIIGGTGELANLRGNGVHWSNGLMDVHYEGQIHFDP
jgi:hypothetical protein